MLWFSGKRRQSGVVRAQEEGLDTVDANRALGLPDDCREYTSVRNILADLGIRSIRLMVRACCGASARPAQGLGSALAASAGLCGCAAEQCAACRRT